jgi:hypothetical protein
VSDAWIPAVNQLETLLISVPAYSKGKVEGSGPSNFHVKVKAAKDLEGVAEGLRIVVRYLRDLGAINKLIFINNERQ